MSKLIGTRPVYSAYNVIAGPITQIFAYGYQTNSHFVRKNALVKVAAARPLNAHFVAYMLAATIVALLVCH